MVSDHLIQRAIINKLKTTTAITDLVSASNIKEDQWQGVDQGFPAIRVNVEDNSPIGNAVGRTKLSSVLFSILIYTEDASSFNCNKIANVVTNNLFDNQIKGTDESGNANYFMISRIDLITSGKALRQDDRTWEKEIFFQSEVYLLS